MLGFLTFGKAKSSISKSVYIKTSNGATVNVQLDPSWDIGCVKQAVAPRLGYEAQDMKIIFAGKELCDSTVIQECDLGEQSILHAVRCTPRSGPVAPAAQPLSQSLLDLQLSAAERTGLPDSEKRKLKAHFYVWCGACHKLQEGKLRVRCAGCKSGAFTVHADPQAWEHVLQPHQITGQCLHTPSCSQVHHERGPSFAEFYFKCSLHTSQGEQDQAIPLYLIKPNLKEIPCLACSDIRETVLVFPCNAGHVTCLDCFRLYCSSRLSERQFHSHTELGYTLGCPARCPNSYIAETHHFRLLTDSQYNQYQRFATEEFVLKAGGVLCPQPGCGMGILLDSGCSKATCLNGCGYVFCVRCLQGYHLGACSTPEEASDHMDTGYSVDPQRANQASWEAASKATIRITSKPCPACRTPTERDGGCMHMICSRGGCGYEWCWVCQTRWTRECMAAHWFG